MAYSRRLKQLALGTLGVLLLANGQATDRPATIGPPSGRTPAVLLSPRLLDPAEHGIGARIPAATVTGVDGRQHRLFDDAAGLGTLVIVRDPTCPVSQRYAPRIKRLAERYRNDFRWVFIYPNVDLTAAQRAADARQFGLPAVYAERGSFALAERLGVASTGDTFVLDADHRLRYRGAVDDQYGLGYTRDLPTAHYLRNAADAVRSREQVQIPATAAPGCYIDADPALDRRMPTVPDNHLLS